MKCLCYGGYRCDKRIFILFNKTELDPNKYNIDIWKHITTMDELIELMKLS